MKKARSKWAVFGAVLGAIGDVALQTVPDALAGAGAGALRTVAEGHLDPASIGGGALIGAAGGALARWGLERARKPKRPECADWRDGGER